MVNDLTGASSSRSATASVSAGIADANAHLPNPSEATPRFPGEDAGRSLAEMAQRDLDAALQLLAERAQYITGASGAAIALRRGQHRDMLCSASAGSNAPELGSLLSMEYGLSGESVRTRQTLRCDDAERDPRVNREGCRQLGIASVVVMPIVCEEQVLGVFELFSGKPNAFSERDISALRRLSEMVETAVKHAVGSHSISAIGQEAKAQSGPENGEPSPDVHGESTIPASSFETPYAPSDSLPAHSSNEASAGNVAAAVTAATEKPIERDAPSVPDEQKTKSTGPDSLAKKGLFWSAAMHTPVGGPAQQIAQSMIVPPVLRNLQKCQACGFPVSQGRTLCVECEEKKWRGQPLAKSGTDQPTIAEKQITTPRNAQREPAATTASEPESDKISALSTPIPISSPVVREEALREETLRGGTASTETTSKEAAVNGSPDAAQQAMQKKDGGPDDATLFMGSVQSEGWFDANKYVLGALLLVAIVVAAVMWLR